MKTKKCLICKSKFNKGYYESASYWNKRKYCSLSCSAKAKERKKESICDYCKKIFFQRPSHYKRKKRHFCSIKCYSLFVENIMLMSEQNAYKGIRKEGESKQVYHRRFCKKHPDIISHLKARRYAREKGAIGNHTLKQWNDLKDSYGNVCAICKKPKKLSKDHIIPLSKGGTDYIENIQPLCHNCNSQKWAN